MNEQAKKKLTVTVAIVLACVITFAIVWSATATMRSRNQCIADIKTNISENRKYLNGEEHTYKYFTIPDSLTTDAKFEEFLVTQVQEMCKNSEIKLLCGYLDMLEGHGYHSAAIAEAVDEYVITQTKELCLNRDTSGLREIFYNLKERTSDAASIEISEIVRDYFLSASNIEEALQIKNALESYVQYLSLNRNSGVIAAYIEKSGTNPITKTRGKGYYADKEDSSSKTTIGIEGSPLYDASSVTYLGDFKYVREWGVDLNQWYEEYNWTDSAYYFRDQYISFSPDDGECVWSGEYLFCFASDGELIDYARVE